MEPLVYGNIFAVQEGRISYEYLYGQHRGRIERLCRLLLSDPDLAEEICQDTFLKLHKALSGQSAHADWERWLTRVAVNGCRDLLRGQWWKRRLRGGEEFNADDYVQERSGPEQALSERRRRLRLHAALVKLPARQREVFVLRHFEGWSTGEVAEQLALSAGSVKRHLFRAVKALRKALREDGQGEPI